MNRSSEFLERLHAGCLIGDGDTTHRLQQLLPSGVNQGSGILNVTHPDLVARAHGEFAEAGADLISTNTFDANAIQMGRLDLADKVREINTKGVELALKHAGKQAWVAGSVGPLGLTLDDEWDLETYRATYREQMASLLEAGVHVVLLKTFGNLAELRLAIGVAKALGGKEFPVIAQAVFNDGGLMESGQNARQTADYLIQSGADVVGANCGRGISGTVNAVKHMAQVTGETPVSAYPNAGFPENDDGRLVYVTSPAYLAEIAIRLARMGVRLIGGCCGISAEAIRAMATAVSTIKVRPLRARSGAAAAPADAATAPAGDTHKTGAMLDSLRFKHPIIAEIDPPPHLLVEDTLNDVRSVVENGADVISLAENPLASLKVGNIAMASLIARQLQVQTICHITCRDRNLLGLQSALMGAHLLGIRGILAVTGDPPPRREGSGLGKGVFDVSSPGLVRLIAQLNRGITNTGKELKQETDFSIGVAFNSSSRNMDGEKTRLEKKLAEGGRFIMTQPVFDADRARRILEITGRYGVRVFLGFFPLVSARTALYLHNEVPGIRIPENLLQQLANNPDAQAQRRIGIEQAQQLLEQLLPDLDGIYLISPHTRERAAILSALIKHVRATAEGRGTVPPTPPDKNASRSDTVKTAIFAEAP